MPVVTVVITASSVDVNPRKAKAKPGERNVTWNITSSRALANPPIEFPWPVPSGVPVPSGGWTQFSGSVTSGSGPNQWQASFPDIGGIGEQQFYKYNVVYSGGFFDPEVENQGPPPTGTVPPFETPTEGKPEGTPGRGPGTDD